MIYPYPWQPRKLVRCAAEYSWEKAFGIGLLALASQMVFPLAVSFNSMGEPLPGLSHYLWGGFYTLAMACLFCLLISATIYTAAALALSPFEVRSAQMRLVSRMIFLGPMLTLLPGLGWSILAAFKIVSHAYNGSSHGAVRPIWLDSPFIQVGGSLLWIVAGALLIAANCMADRDILRAFASSPGESFCKGCGYDLTGNVSGKCPECAAEAPKE